MLAHGTAEATESAAYLPEATESAAYRPDATESAGYHPESTESAAYRPEAIEAAGGGRGGAVLEAGAHWGEAAFGGGGLPLGCSVRSALP